MRLLDLKEYKTNKNTGNEDEEGIVLIHKDNSFKEMIEETSTFIKNSDYLNLQRSSKFLLPKTQLHHVIENLSLLYVFIKEIEENEICVEQLKILTAGVVV